MARDTNEILGHGADADGIEEYDNPLPDWWLGLFGVTIVFAAIYPVWYHGFGNSQVTFYEAEMAAAEARWPQPEGPQALPTDAASLAAGEEVFATTCASCHKADLSGGIGPNLVDATWIHGGEPQDILKTVSEGVTDKGMPAWGKILGPQKVQQVAAFVVSKQGSAPAPAEVVEPAPAEADPGPAAVDVVPVADGPPDGAKIYAANCAVCHKPDLTGQVGPNLVDDEWLHGGELDQIRHTITEGVPAKGMISWKPMLKAEEIDAVARFVHQGGKNN